MSTKSQGDALKNRLLKLMAIRVLVVTLMMGFTAAIQLKEGGRVLAPSLISIYILIATSYLLTFLSVITLKLVEKSDRFADLQIASDILLATALIYVTGGIDSIFSFLYIFIIIGAGIVLQGRWVILSASLSSILYGALLDLQYFGFLPVIENPLSQPKSYSGMQVFYRVFGNITAFHTVAFLSRHLFVQLKKTRERLKDSEEAVRRAEKLAAIGQLAAGIAHEIRNPLASMSGSIQVLRDELDLNPENKRLMDIILRESERLNRLITEFLDYARPYKPERAEVDFSGILSETLDVFEKGLSQGHGITIQREVSPGIKVYGEQERLREVLWNLFNNAVQSMPGGGRLTVSLKAEDGVAVAAIRDTGEGIEEKDIGRVFEPFFTTKTSGTGLGLATVYRIVEAHDGDIRVESKKGKGTLFTVSLPKNR